MTSISKVIPLEEKQAPDFVDLGPFLDGDNTPEIPSIAETVGGRGLFYAGRLNEIHSEPGNGKTLVLMAACIAVMENGGHVVYLDPEDTPRAFVARMLALGATRESLRTLAHYLHNPEPSEILDAQMWASETRPALVVLDGLAELMAAQGLSEDKAAEVLTFFRINLRPFAEAGCAVAIADHVTKSSESRGQFARGSGAKAGRYDGVSYDLVPGLPFTPTQAGFAKLKIAKDRNGGAGPRGKIVAEVHFSPSINGRTDVDFRLPEESGDGPFRPSAIMDKVVAHLRAYSEDSKSGVCAAISSKKEHVLKAIEILAKEGALTVTANGKSRTLRLTKDSQNEA